MFEWLFKVPLDSFADGELVFAGAAHWTIVLLAAAVAGALGWFFAARRAPSNIPKPTRWVLGALRALVLALLAAILFHLVLRVPQPQRRSVFTAVVVDDSRSMRIPDVPADGNTRITRLAAARTLLGAGEQDGAGGLVHDLAGVCPVKLFKFSSAGERIDRVADVTGTGPRTNLYAALDVVQRNLRNVPVAAVVLVTDGADNAEGNPVELARHMGGLGRPVYVIGLGDPTPPADYEVVRVHAPREVRANTAVDVHANVRAASPDRPFEVILERDGEELMRKTQLTTPGVYFYRVDLSFQADQKGKQTYTIRIPAAPGETIVDNNTLSFPVTVTDRRLPVLYLEGSPREEYRFLRRALFRDKDFRIVSILRVGGPKGFLLQGAEPDDGLEKGFPDTAEKLARFEAILLGDIEAGYLTPAQLGLIETAVREHGRGFCMLGGVNAFNLGGYQKTAIDRMLPVVLPAPNVSYKQVEFRITLSEIGHKHPIMQQNSNPLFNRRTWDEAPPLIGFNPIDAVKPGAQVLAVNSQTGQPVLVAQNYGAGRAAAFTSGGSWYWQMSRPREDELHEKFWKQLVRWLAVGAKAKLTVELNKDLFLPDESVEIRATVLDKTLAPDEGAKVTARIKDPFNADPRTVPMRSELIEEGVFTAGFTPADVGDYAVEVTAELSDGTRAVATATFSVGETLEEFRDPAQKVETLRAIADASGGRYVPPAEAASIPGLIDARVRRMRTDLMEYEHKDIWDTPLLFALLVVSLTVEWALRRRAGMM